MIENKPKVFISYSWSCSERVMQLAERLVADGVDVVIDKWDLREGQDKYAFMEQAVTNSDIDRVLMVCDSVYTKKADDRTGGVGDEAMIISPKIYGAAEQAKFIPIIFELDQEQKPFCPAFVTSRIYIDLSQDNEKYEAEYEKLLRNIFNKPQYRKPALGKMPEWLENEQINLAPARDIIKQIKGYAGGNESKIDYLIKQATSIFSTTLREYSLEPDNPMTPDDFLAKIDEHKPLRDLIFDFIEAIAYCGLALENIIPTLFEELYNVTHNIGNISSYPPCIFENIDYFIWESFIGMTAILLHHERYAQLNSILSHTYFLRESLYINASIKAYNFAAFSPEFSYIESECKPVSDNPRWHSMAAEMLTHREKKPYITLKSITEADVVLYQIYHLLDLGKGQYRFWFPYTYVYCGSKSSLWIRLKSKEYCEKVLPLFGVDSIEDLKTRISEKDPSEHRFRSEPYGAPGILSSIILDEIGSMN